MSDRKAPVIRSSKLEPVVNHFLTQHETEIPVKEQVTHHDIIRPDRLYPSLSQLGGLRTQDQPDARQRVDNTRPPSETTLAYGWDILPNYAADPRMSQHGIIRPAGRGQVISPEGVAPVSEAREYTAGGRGRRLPDQPISSPSYETPGPGNALIKPSKLECVMQHLTSRLVADRYLSADSNSDMSSRSTGVEQHPGVHRPHQGGYHGVGFLSPSPRELQQMAGGHHGGCMPMSTPREQHQMTGGHHGGGVPTTTPTEQHQMAGGHHGGGVPTTTPTEQHQMTGGHQGGGVPTTTPTEQHQMTGGHQGGGVPTTTPTERHQMAGGHHGGGVPTTTPAERQQMAGGHQGGGVPTTTPTEQHQMAGGHHGGGVLTTTPTEQHQMAGGHHGGGVLTTTPTEQHQMAGGHHGGGVLTTTPAEQHQMAGGYHGGGVPTTTPTEQQQMAGGHHSGGVPTTTPTEQHQMAGGHHGGGVLTTTPAEQHQMAGGYHGGGVPTTTPTEQHQMAGGHHSGGVPTTTPAEQHQMAGGHHGGGVPTTIPTERHQMAGGHHGGGVPTTTPAEQQQMTGGHQGGGVPTTTPTEQHQMAGGYHGGGVPTTTPTEQHQMAGGYHGGGVLTTTQTEKHQMAGGHHSGSVPTTTPTEQHQMAGGHHNGGVPTTTPTERQQMAGGHQGGGVPTTTPTERQQMAGGHHNGGVPTTTPTEQHQMAGGHHNGGVPTTTPTERQQMAGGHHGGGVPTTTPTEQHQMAGGHHNGGVPTTTPTEQHQMAGGHHNGGVPTTTPTERQQMAGGHQGGGVPTTTPTERQQMAGGHHNGGVPTTTPTEQHQMAGGHHNGGVPTTTPTERQQMAGGHHGGGVPTTTPTEQHQMAGGHHGGDVPTTTPAEQHQMAGGHHGGDVPTTTPAEQHQMAGGHHSGGVPTTTPTEQHQMTGGHHGGDVPTTTPAEQHQMAGGHHGGGVPTTTPAEQHQMAGGYHGGDVPTTTPAEQHQMAGGHHSGGVPTTTPTEQHQMAGGHHGGGVPTTTPTEQHQMTGGHHSGGVPTTTSTEQHQMTGGHHNGGVPTTTSTERHQMTGGHHNGGVPTTTSTERHQMTGGHHSGGVPTTTSTERHQMTGGHHNGGVLTTTSTEQHQMAGGHHGGDVPTTTPAEQHQMAGGHHGGDVPTTTPAEQHQMAGGHHGGDVPTTTPAEQQQMTGGHHGPSNTGLDQDVRDGTVMKDGRRDSESSCHSDFVIIDQESFEDNGMATSGGFENRKLEQTKSGQISFEEKNLDTGSTYMYDQVDVMLNATYRHSTEEQRLALNSNHSSVLKFHDGRRCAVPPGQAQRVQKENLQTSDPDTNHSGRESERGKGHGDAIGNDPGREHTPREWERTRQAGRTSHNHGSTCTPDTRPSTREDRQSLGSSGGQYGYASQHHGKEQDGASINHDPNPANRGYGTQGTSKGEISGISDHNPSNRGYGTQGTSKGEISGISDHNPSNRGYGMQGTSKGEISGISDQNPSNQAYGKFEERESSRGKDGSREETARERRTREASGGKGNDTFTEGCGRNLPAEEKGRESRSRGHLGSPQGPESADAIPGGQMALLERSAYKHHHGHDAALDEVERNVRSSSEGGHTSSRELPRGHLAPDSRARQRAADLPMNFANQPSSDDSDDSVKEGNSRKGSFPDLDMLDEAILGATVIIRDTVWRELKKGNLGNVLGKLKLTVKRHPEVVEVQGRWTDIDTVKDLVCEVLERSSKKDTTRRPKGESAHTQKAEMLRMVDQGKDFQRTQDRCRVQDEEEYFMSKSAEVHEMLPGQHEGQQEKRHSSSDHHWKDDAVEEREKYDKSRYMNSEKVDLQHGHDQRRSEEPMEIDDLGNVQQRERSAVGGPGAMDNQDVTAGNFPAINSPASIRKSRRKNRVFKAAAEENPTQTQSTNNLMTAGQHDAKPSTRGHRGKVFTTPEGLTLFVHHGDITTLSDVDCVVNSTDQKLTHGGGAAAAIKKAAGPGFVKMCDGKKLTPGQCITTGAGNLPYKRVLHVYMECWIWNNEPRHLKQLQETVDTILKTAEKEKMISVALSGIGTGVQKFPKDKWVKVVVETIEKFSKKGGNKSLKEIHFVDNNTDLLEVIKQGLSEAFYKNPPVTHHSPPVQGARGGGSASRSSSGSSFLPATFEISSSCKVVVDKTDLTLFIGDAIVITENGSFTGQSPLAKAVETAAGASYTSDKTKAFGHAKPGEVVMIKAGHLPCKQVLVGVLSRIAGKEMGRQEMGALVQAILKKADAMGLQSIAIPAIFSGVAGLSTNEGCELLVDEICKFVNKTHKCSLKKVSLLDRDVAKVEHFCYSLTKHVSKLDPEIPTANPELQNQASAIGMISQRKTGRGITAGSNQGLPATFGISKFCHIIADKTNITKFHGDAIVITDDDYLFGLGPLATAVDFVGGESYRSAKLQAKSHHRPLPGSVCVTSAGNLPVQHVFHAIVRLGVTVREVLALISAILKKADSMDLKTIAIPDICSGLAGLSTDKACELLVDEICNFVKNTPNSSLGEIHLVDTNMDKVEYFCLALTQYMSNIEAGNPGRDPPADAASSGHQASGLMGAETTNTHTVTTSRPTNIMESLPATFCISGSCTVHVNEEDIVRFGGDAIAITVDNDLTPASATGKAVWTSSGESLKWSQIKAKPRDVVVTTGGNLSCRFVLHGMLSRWAGSTMGLEELRSIVKSILYEADRKSVRTLAIPALWEGRTGISPRSGCCAMLDEICNFVKSKPGSPLREIHLLDTDFRVLGSFCDELDRRFPNSRRIDANKGGHGKILYSEAASGRQATAQDRDGDGEMERKVCRICQGRRSGMKRRECGHVVCGSCLTPGTTRQKCCDMDAPAPGAQAMSREEADDNLGDCVICMSQITDPRELPCGHVFCTGCVEQWFSKSSKVCPVCKTVCGKIVGNQPPGAMDVTETYQSCSGFEGYRSYVIDYKFPSGRQEEGHPHPGKPYKGARRTAYLPKTPEGKAILKLLRQAFDQRLLFTIGRSVTTGRDDVVTWNDVHHKTSLSGGSEKFGYPDPTYLSRVREELKAKGVVEDTNGTPV